MMENKVFNFIQQQHMIEEGDRIVVGVSGGADSVCLLLLLLEYQKKVSFRLAVVHVNHGIREEAREDAAYVGRLCREYSLPFFLYERSVPAIAKREKLSMEEAGRKVRYEAFEEALTAWNSKENEADSTGRIAVAHHSMDSAETMLFNLFRGTGIRGLAGIRPIRGKIIRPLLCLSRDEIELYLRQRNISWCIDSTNEEDTYTRNKIRNQLFPYVERELVSSAAEHVARTALEVARLTDYLDEETKKAAEACCKLEGFSEKNHEKEKIRVSLCLKSWRRLPPFLQDQVLLWALEQISEGRKDIGSIHLAALMELAVKDGYKRTDLPGGLEGVKEYETLIIRPKTDKRKEEAGQKEDIELTVPGNFRLENGMNLELLVIDREKIGRIEENQYTKYLDYDKINNCLSLRYRQGGDFLVINEKGQKKLLKEYMIQEKIAAPLRESIPLIAEGKHILWVIGYRISAFYKVTENTRRCLRMKIWRD